jgi:hypothetical protein
MDVEIESWKSTISNVMHVIADERVSGYWRDCRAWRTEVARTARTREAAKGIVQCIAVIYERWKKVHVGWLQPRVYE